MYAPNKKLGQNFLKNKRIIIKMINSLDSNGDEIIIEIGGGLGAITLELANYFHSAPIKTIEIDPRYIVKLKNMFIDHRNVEIIEGNVIDWLPKFESDKEILLIGSLPYYVTTPIIHGIIKMKQQPKTCTLLVQKEVAEKITQDAPKSSPISIFVQTFYEIEYLGKVDKKDFSPKPKVDGGIIKLSKRDGVDLIDIRKYERFLKKTFSNPRKMLNKIFTEDERNRASIDNKKRAQEYGWEHWYKAFRILV